MSVAFRRDGDEEHLEPRFELPIPPGPNLVTPRGLALIGDRVAALQSEVARLQNEQAEDAAIKAVQRDLRYWHTRQVTAEVAPMPDGATAQIGTTVSFRLNGKVQRLGFVGHDEADPVAKLIAFSAPLARALIGAEVGELLDFNGRDEAIEVLAIEVAASA